MLSEIKTSHIRRALVWGLMLVLLAMLGLLLLELPGSLFWVLVCAIMIPLVFALEYPVAWELSVDDEKVVARHVYTAKVKEFYFKDIESFKIVANLSDRKFGFHFALLLAKTDGSSLSIPLKYVDDLKTLVLELEKKLQNRTEDPHGLIKLRLQQDEQLDGQR